MSKPRHPQTTEKGVTACSAWHQGGVSRGQCSSHRPTWHLREGGAELAPEAKILVIASTLAAWKEEDEERQEGETKTEREADSESGHLRAALWLQWRELPRYLDGENPPLCAYHYVHSDSTLHEHSWPHHGAWSSPNLTGGKRNRRPKNSQQGQEDLVKNPLEQKPKITVIPLLLVRYSTSFDSTSFANYYLNIFKPRSFPPFL